MDESTIRGMESLELEDRETPPFENPHLRICVEGYDPSLRGDELKRALSMHFLSCRTIGIMANPIDFVKVSVNRSFITMFGDEKYTKKALERNGSDMGGWNLVVTPFPYPQPIPELVGWVPPPTPEPIESFWMTVMGFDFSLPKDEIKSSLNKHFSSCGKITKTVKLVSDKKLKVLIEGEGGLEKALMLSRCECDVRGCKIAAKKYRPSKRRICGYTRKVPRRIRQKLRILIEGEGGLEKYMGSKRPIIGYN